MVFVAFFKRRFSCLEDIIELILCLWEFITPKKFKLWFKRQRKFIRYIIGPLYFTVPLIVFVIIVWSIFSLIP